MVSTSKILTVSYGTFSCTLEGFDDSFDTMKAIAEYFRDLAADDRYFGAEPPTPDAEMLARIAGREISRRVDAHQGETGIVLRATQSPQELAPQELGRTEATPDQAPEAPQAAQPAETAEMQPEPAAPAPEQAAQQEIAAQETAEVETSVDETGVADTSEVEETSTHENEEPATEVPAAFEDLPASAAETPETPEPADDGDSVAARLRRIRSVVARSGASYGSDYSEDEHAQDFLARTADELEMTLAGDDEAEAVEPQAEITDFDDFAGFADNEADEDDETDGTIEWDAAEDDADDDTSVVDALDGLAARLAEEAEAVDTVKAAPVEADTGEADDFDDDEALEDALSEDTLSQLLADAIPGDEPLDEPRETQSDTTHETAGHPAAPRVLKMKRSEFEALALGEFDELDEEDIAAEEPEDTAPETIQDAKEPGENAVLSPEEEAELLLELAEVEAELSEISEETGEYEGEDANIFGDTDTDDDQGADAEAEAEAAEMPYDRPAEQGRGTHLHTSGADNDASRIFDEAESKLDAPDASRRRNAIQHLRAAVAASKAEIRAGNRLEPDPGVQQAAYRSDLAQVVRPRRPQADRGSRSARPEDTRPAPLKLVAEQRIDTQRAPVRPRRISATQMAAEAAEGAPADSGFADFAREIGVAELPDLLEAAAAYLADIEGHEQFSRPMLMGKLKEATGEAFSREDGLRSFGNLLRHGKLQKLRGGRFTVTEQTEFRAQASRAAG